MGDLPIVAFIGFAILAIAVTIFGAIRAKKRREAMEVWAARHGLAWRPDRDPTMDERFPHLECLRKGDGRYAYNICHGKAGDRYLWAFDYHYETHSTESDGMRETHHHRLSVIVIQTRLPLKPLHIRPEHFLDKVGEFFGMDDIDFESAEFSKRYCVRAPDRRWAFDVITQETMEFLLAEPRYTIAMENGRVGVYDGSKFSPDGFESALSVGQGILDRLPRSVLEEMREGA